MGLVEILGHFPVIRRAFNRLKAQLQGPEPPDALVLIDFPEFNLRLAKVAKAAGVPVLYYVSPQVWAWRPGRVKSYGRIIDHMAVIFPFELPFYEAYGVPATYVGHPLAGKVKPSMSRSEALKKYGLTDSSANAQNNGGSRPVIGLLPGSRANEIKRLMPVILESARRLSLEFPAARFLLFQAASVEDAAISAKLAGVAGLDLQVIRGQDYDALQCCDTVITVSGTATLEIALLGIPMVIVYRLAPLSYWLGRLLVKVPFIGLPNILAGKGIVREFIQHEATPANIAGEIARILQDSIYSESQRQALLTIRDKLGDRNGSAVLARLAADMLATS
jgi:lipid-A-disaccharide synthase